MLLRCPILLSYPRCGNSWLRFCIEVISGQPTWPESKYIVGLRDYVDIKNEEYILRKDHSLYDKDNYENIAIANNSELYRKLQLILLLRNYKECILRQMSPSIYEQGLFYDRYNFMENINEFDNWPENLRLLIYYEELIQDPHNTLIKCADFLKLSHEKVDKFMENYDKYKELSLDSYENNQGDMSHTRGETLIHHSNSLTAEQAHEWDEKIKEKYPNLFAKYLTRYAV